MTSRIELTVKALSIIFLFLLFGCATSTAELVEQAQLTGDWSLVDERDAARDRREARSQSCRIGETKYCEGRPGSENCSCVSTSGIQDMMRSTQRNTGFSRRPR